MVAISICRNSARKEKSRNNRAGVLAVLACVGWCLGRAGVSAVLASVRRAAATEIWGKKQENDMHNVINYYYC